jgi:DnaJ like chaperone protein
MTWWGKLAGGAFGFMLGGPLGAALGAVLGHQFDRGMAELSDGGRIANSEKTQTVFFTAVFTIMGYIAKVDGRVSPNEIAMAEEVMRQMRLNEQQRDAAIGLFRQGKRTDFPVNDVLDQLRHQCGRRTTLLQMFLEIQVQAAFADGGLDHVERQALLHMAERLGFSRRRFQQILGFIEGASAYERSATTGRQPSLEDAYKTLGVTSATSDAEVKKAYRRLMNQHHPDKLVAKGLPEEMIKLATERTQEIRNAYEQIRGVRQTQ